MYCQGLVRVMFESYSPRALSYDFWRRSCRTSALGRLSAASEIFSVTVIDDRAEFADIEKHGSVDRVILTDRHYTQDVPATDPETYIVIVTRCHATDQLLVKRYLKVPSAYLGLIGSRAKVRQFRKELIEQGMTEKLLDRLHAPIGLPIGGKDPPEVAISILAELVQVKNSNVKPALLSLK